MFKVETFAHFQPVVKSFNIPIINTNPPIIDINIIISFINFSKGNILHSPSHKVVKHNNQMQFLMLCGLQTINQ